MPHMCEVATNITKGIVGHVCAWSAVWAQHGMPEANKLTTRCTLVLQSPSGPDKNHGKPLGNRDTIPKSTATCLGARTAPKQHVDRNHKNSTMPRSMWRPLVDVLE